MGKRKSKATTAGSVWSSLPWKKASTSTNSAAGDDDDDESSSNDQAAAHPDDLGYNHYDDPDTTDARFEGELYDAEASSSSKGKKGGGKKRKMQQSASSGGMEGADDPGILFGFEVVDASHFIVKKEKVGGGEVSRVIPVTSDDGDYDNNDDDDDDEGRAAAPEQKKAKKAVKSSKSEPKKNSRNAHDDGNDTSDDDDAKGNSTVESEEEEIRQLKKRLKRKEAKLRKKKRKQEEAEKKKKQQEDNNCKDDGDAGPTQQEMDAVRTNWSVSAPGVYLHGTLCRGLAKQGFATPMPIQSSTLPASILGRRDIVGAAPTGSGKTLAYALPMLQGILEARDEAKDDDGSDGDADEEPTKKKGDTRPKEPLTGLVLCPTRELAVQVSSEIQKVCCNEVGVGTIVGGLAEQKQKRVLNVKRPPILVATPGRLWELVSFLPFFSICMHVLDQRHSVRHSRYWLVMTRHILHSILFYYLNPSRANETRNLYLHVSLKSISCRKYCLP